MRYMIIEGIRRFIQMFFSISIWNIPVVANIRRFFYSLIFDIKKPKNISDHVVIFRAHSNVDKFEDQTRVGALHIKEGINIEKDVEIDYSGSVTIGRFVEISEGVKIFSHIHEMHPDRIYHKSFTIHPTKIEIGDYVWIGTNAIILPGVNKIGHNVIIEPGSVVTKNIPDNAIVIGNPAKVVRYLTEKEKKNE